ncbi:prepilin peptidase [Candidatus Woesearchaeota archaeon]|nr:prepilin peptidase [Candidatus Woesearchaeota archaeon]
MIFEILLIVTTLTILSISSYTDLKTREVPDILSYSLIFIALGLRVLFSFVLGKEIIISGLLGLFVGFLIAAAFYYTHQWGGADSKLLMGMGAVIGIPLALNLQTLYFFIFLLALLFIGAFYGLIWMAYLAIKNKEKFWKKYKSNVHEYGRMHLALWIATILFIAISFKLRFLLIISIFPILLFYVFVFVTTIEQSFFTKWISVKKLTEGDWLIGDVIVHGKTIMEKKTIELEDLEQLRKLYNQGKLKTVKIREGIPFVPSFLLAYIVFLVFIHFRNLFIP